VRASTVSSAEPLSRTASSPFLASNPFRSQRGSRGILIGTLMDRQWPDMSQRSDHGTQRTGAADRCYLPMATFKLRVLDLCSIPDCPPPLAGLSHCKAFLTVAGVFP
jgi:hypothetical protein